MKRIRRKQWFIALVLVTVLAIYLNRAYARIYSFIDSHYIPNPNVTKSYLISHGANPAKEQPRLRYVAIGDSLTAGVGSPNPQRAFPYVLAELFASNGHTVEMTNLGIPGAKTADVLRYEVNQAIDLNPDYVTVLIGVNDMHGFTSLPQFAQQYAQLLDALTTRTNAHIIVLNDPFLGTRKLMWPPYRWFFDLRTKAYNDVIRGIVQSRKVTFIDLYNESKDTFKKNPDFYATDEFHPSASGYTYWANSIYANFRIQSR